MRQGVDTAKNKGGDATTLKPARASARRTANGGAAAAPRYTAGFVAAFGSQTPSKPAPANDLRQMVDHETGEIFQVKRAHDCSLHIEQTPSQKRATKYQRQAAYREILGGKHRIAACHRNPIKNAKQVEVWGKLDAYLPGHFVGVQTCGLGWICSICSPKISERRAGEIQKAMDKCQADGGMILMPTFTIPHGRHQPLAETLDLIKQALRWMAMQRQYKQLQAGIDVRGRIISTEITHGEANGWHPHFHELWFFDGVGVNVKTLEQTLYELWVKACDKFDLGEPSRKHGVVVQDGSKAAQYVAKMSNKEWTLADEMAKANAKSGRQANRSIWQLLDCYNDPNASTQHRNRAAQLLREYEAATKGVRALRWSPGLKKHYGIAELTDEELAAQIEEEAVLLAEISLDDWRIVRKHNLQAVILDAAMNGREAIAAILNAYRSM